MTVSFGSELICPVRVCAGPPPVRYLTFCRCPGRCCPAYRETIRKGGAAMSTPVTVSETDLRTLLGIAGDDRSDLPEAGLPPSLLSDLMVQVRCEALTFSGQDTRRLEFVFAQSV